jgi:hypothetical protein
MEHSTIFIAINPHPGNSHSLWEYPTVVPESGLFPIRSSPGDYFYAGHLPADRQALIARCVYGYIIMLVFDQSGTLLNTFWQDLPSSLLLDGTMPGYYEVEEAEFNDYLRRAFGFTLGLIHVREFHIPKEMLAVYRLPKFYQEFLDDPNGPTFDDELRQSLPDLIKRWREEGRFVLEWGNDFWLDSNGEVTDS